MFNFSTKSKYVPTWNENDKLPEASQFYVNFTLLDMGELLAAMDALTQLGLPAGEKSTQADTLKHQKIMYSVAQNFLPSRVEFVNAPDFKPEFLKYAQFYALTAELFAQLMQLSQPSENDVKN